MALASEKLHYNCKADVVESIYCRLKVLKVEFQEKADAMMAAQIPPIRFYNKLFKVPKQEVITLPDTSSSEEEIIDIPASMPGQNKNTNETDAERDIAKGKLLNAQLDLKQKMCATREERDIAKGELLKAQLDLIETMCAKREEALLKKEQKMIAEIENFKEREVMHLKKEQKTRLESFSGTGVEDEVRKVKEEFERKMSALEAHVGKERERLKVLHAAARELERGIKEGWVQNSKSGNLEDDFDNVPLSDCGKFILQEFKWDPPTTPPLILEENLIERDGDEDMASVLPNNTPSHTPQETSVIAVEVTPVVAATHGDTAEESIVQHRDGETSSVESHRNTMMKQETLPANAAEPTPPADTPDLAPPAEAAESSTPAQMVESISSLTATTTVPALVEVAVANGDIMAGPVLADSVGVLPPDPSAYVSRDAASHPLPQQSHGAVLPSQVPPQVPIPVALVQDAGRQGAQININNVVCNGLGTANENGTTVGVRLGAGCGPPWQMLPMASPMVFPHGLHADPLKNELTRIKQQEDHLARRYETKKMQLNMEMEEEFERSRRRYEEMLQEEENTYQRQKQHLEEVYRKVQLNQSLAEEFRAKFIEHRAPPSSASASSQLSNLVPVPRQLPTQSRVPQQIQRVPASPAVAPRPGSASTNGNSNRPPSIAALRISSTSSPLRPLATSQSPMRASFSPVSLPPRPGPVLRTNNRAPAPHLTRARPHISAPASISTPNPMPDSVAASATQQLRSLLAQQLQEGPAALSQTQTQNLPVDFQLQERSAALNQPETQNFQVESMLASFGNSGGTGQVAAVGDGVVCLSDDD